MRGDLEGIPPGPMVGVPGVSPSESDAAASSRPSTPPELIRAALGRASRSAVPSLPPDPDPDPSCDSSPDASPEPDPECIAPVGFARRRADLSFPMRRCAFELGSWMSVSRVLMALSSRVPSPSPSSSARMMLSSFFTCSREKGRARRYRVGSDGGSTRCVEEVTVDGENGAGRRRGDAEGDARAGRGGIRARGSARTFRYGHLVMPCSRHRCLRTVTHRPSCGDGCGDEGVRVGSVRNRGGGHRGRVLFLFARREKPRSTWTVAHAPCARRR